MELFRSVVTSGAHIPQEPTHVVGQKKKEDAGAVELISAEGPGNGVGVVIRGNNCVEKHRDLFRYISLKTTKAIKCRDEPFVFICIACRKKVDRCRILSLNRHITIIAAE